MTRQSREALRGAFAQRLRTIMAQSGLTVGETARRASASLPEGEGVLVASISQYRYGRVMPRLRHLEALASALGVEQADLVPEGADLDGTAEDRTVTAEDRGGRAHLRADVAVPWAVALQVIELLRADGTLHQDNGRVQPATTRRDPLTRAD